MTESDIERMAREAGFSINIASSLDSIDGRIARFAGLVRAQALEDAARVADDFLTRGRSPLGRTVAAAIRAIAGDAK